MMVISTLENTSFFKSMFLFLLRSSRLLLQLDFQSLFSEILGLHETFLCCLCRNVDKDFFFSLKLESSSLSVRICVGGL